MAKSPYTPEWKITIIKKYLSGEGSYERLADAYGIGSKTLKDWVHRYKEQGAVGFYRAEGNAHYSKEFKTMCVEAVIKGLWMILSLNIIFPQDQYSIVGFRCIMPIWNSKIMNRNGRSIWQKHGERQRWKSGRKS